MFRAVTWFPSHECVIWLVPLASPNLSAHTNVFFSWMCNLTCSSCHTPSFSSRQLLFLLNVIWLVPILTPHLSPHANSCFSWMWFDLSHSPHPIFLLTPTYASPECVIWLVPLATPHLSPYPDLCFSRMCDLTCPSRHTPSVSSPRLMLCLNVWFDLSLSPHPIILLTLMYSSLECVIWLVPLASPNLSAHINCILNVWFDLFLSPHPIVLLTLTYASTECVIWLVPLTTPHLSPYADLCFSWMRDLRDLTCSSWLIHLSPHTLTYASPECVIWLVQLAGVNTKPSALTPRQDWSLWQGPFWAVLISTP